MTRTRINIDVDNNLLGWIDLTATVVGATRTETARALLQIMSGSQQDHAGLTGLIRNHREHSNQSRAASLAARRQAQRQ